MCVVLARQCESCHASFELSILESESSHRILYKLFMNCESYEYQCSIDTDPMEILNSQLCHLNLNCYLLVLKRISSFSRPVSVAVAVAVPFPFLYINIFNRFIEAHGMESRNN